MRKLFLILICLSLLLSNVFAASDEITNMESQITVDENGICRVTVLAEVRFANRPTTFLFPLGTDAKDVVASGASYDLKTLDGVKCVIFENESGFSGSIAFQCSYTLPCTMREFSNRQQFTAKLPERGWELPINHFKLSTTFPAEITNFPRWKSAYYGDVIDNYLTIQVSDNTVTAKSNIVFRDHETLTMDLDFQPDAFVLKHLAEKSVPFDRIAFISLYLLCIGYWLVALWTGRNKDKKKLSFQYRSSAGEVPCQLFGEDADIGALIAHWGNLGYILLRRAKGNHLRLEKQMEMGNERSTAERRIFQSIFRSTSVIEVAGPRFMAAINAEKSVLRSHWKKRMFQKKDGSPDLFLFLCLASGFFLSLMLFDILWATNPGRWIWIVILTFLSLPLYRFIQKIPSHWFRPTRWIYMGLGGASIVILYLLAVPAELGVYLFFNLLLQLGAGYVTRFGGRRTVPGQETVLGLLDLRHLIRHGNRDFAKEILRRDSQYYYRVLPYAEILGVEKRFHKYFGAVTTEPCPWFIDERNASLSAATFYKFYIEFIHRIRSENRSVFLRSLSKNLAASLPRIRPVFGGGSGHTSGSSSHSKRSGRSTSHRSTSRRSSSGRSSTRSHTHPSSRRSYTTAGSRHRTNAAHSGKRS